MEHGRLWAVIDELEKEIRQEIIVKLSLALLALFVVILFVYSSIVFFDYFTITKQGQPVNTITDLFICPEVE